jgi:hypothetical protein
LSYPLTSTPARSVAVLLNLDATPVQPGNATGEVVVLCRRKLRRFCAGVRDKTAVHSRECPILRVPGCLPECMAICLEPASSSSSKSLKGVRGPFEEAGGRARSSVTSSGVLAEGLGFIAAKAAFYLDWPFAPGYPYCSGGQSSTPPWRSSSRAGARPRTSRLVYGPL